MKTVCFFIFIVQTISFTYAQNVATMNQGGWKTTNTNRFTRIAGTNNLNNKVYRINCTQLVDVDLIEFNILVDDILIPAKFQEGSSVLVEGKSIAIQQATQGTMIKGDWQIVQELDIPATISPWSYSPKLNTDLLIGFFVKDQEFLISINSSTTNCSNSSFNIYIDDLLVKDNNNKAIAFIEGSTLYGKGKKIIIRAIGNCTTNSSIQGELRVFKLR